MPVKKLGAAVHHHNSAAMSALLSPTLGIRDAQRKAGLTPRDHSKDNRQIIKELSRANKGKKLEEAAKALEPYTPPRTSSKYAAVRSRVVDELARPPSAPPKASFPAAPKNFQAGKPPRGLEANVAWAQPPPISTLAPDAADALKQAHRIKTKPPVPPRPTSAPSRPATAENILARNARAAASTPKRTERPSPALTPSPSGTYSKGPSHATLPAYLLDRKLEVAAAVAAREAAARPRECPPGTHILPEAERVAILAGVRESKAKVEAELDGMPFVKHTLGLRLRHDSLKKELDELDAAECAARRAILARKFGRNSFAAIRRNSRADAPPRSSLRRRAFSRRKVIVCDDGRVPGCSYELKTEVEEAAATPTPSASPTPSAVAAAEAEAASAAVEFHRMGLKLKQHAADDAEAGAMFSRMGEKLAQMEEDDAEAGAAFSRLADALTKKEEEAAVVGEQFARLGMMLAEKAVGPEEA